MTALDNPPKEDDMVLNSTCFISGAGDVSVGSAWII